MGWFRNLGRDKPWAQGCVIAAAGLLLSVGTCFGFLFTMNFNTGSSTYGDTITGLMMAFMVLCAFAVPAGGIWFILGLVKSANAKKAAAANPLQPPPVDPPPPGPIA